jgi:hypothetical protein
MKAIQLPTAARSLLLPVVFLCAFVYPAHGGGSAEGEGTSVKVEYSPDYNSKQVKARSDELQGTVVTCSFDEEISPFENCIFSCSFNLAWNRLSELLPEHEVEVRPSTPLADYLNKREFTEEVLSESAYLADAALIQPGTAEKVIAGFNDRLRAKFKDPLLLELDPDLVNLENPLELIAFAYFEKCLEFVVPFEGGHTLTFRSGDRSNEVVAFGFAGEKGNSGRGSIEYLSGGHPAREFVVSLETKEPKDELILALIEPRETLRDTYGKVMGLLSSKSAYPLSNAAVMLVPKMNFQVEHDYRDLLKKTIVTGSDTFTIAQAKNVTRFVLDEFGARVKSLSSIAAVKSIPLELVFDRPFMIIMKEKQSPLPYFAVWVGNAELLSRR